LNKHTLQEFDKLLGVEKLDQAGSDDADRSTAVDLIQASLMLD
jgi:hypothetical protein